MNRASTYRLTSHSPYGLDPYEWARAAATAASIDAAFQYLKKRLTPLGITTVSFVFDSPLTKSPPFPPKPQRFGVCISAEWEQRLESDSALALGEPIARRFAQAEQPLFLWRDGPLAKSFSEPERRYLDLYEDHGMKSGAAFPVHDRRTGTVNVLFLCDSEPQRCVEELSQRDGNRLQLAFMHFCEGLRVRHLAERSPRSLLSPRERDCLCWVAAGYSTKEIADRLSLADATVNEFIANAMRKLECSNRAQACARATLLSLIQP